MKNSKNGFAMVDVLLAVLVLAIGIGFLTGLFTTAKRNAGYAETLTNASFVAEQAKNNLRLPRAKSPLNEEGLAKGTQTMGGLEYTWRASRIKSDPGTDRVVLVVTWEDFMGLHNQRFLTSIPTR
ncbi:MAG TPA: hypothetical protein PKH07_02930 [bacterium]|nr:hypothetical protein [bacterium]